jgi:hypothetical protein
MLIDYSRIEEELAELRRIAELLEISQQIGP